MLPVGTPNGSTANTRTNRNRLTKTTATVVRRRNGDEFLCDCSVAGSWGGGVAGSWISASGAAFSASPTVASSGAGEGAGSSAATGSSTDGGSGGGAAGGGSGWSMVRDPGGPLAARGVALRYA